ncbi:MAG: PTS sugar transporter subunit IIA [Mariprofundales bacterium]|nr:PTS sugar transporter subunit IIA [Mariprofundales bacterium]
MISPDNIVLESETSSKRAALNQLAERLTSLDPDQIMNLVMARERLGSTGIGHGVALPHGRMPGLSEPIIALLRHHQGVDFDAIDGQPVHIVILLLVPDDDDKGHLELLAQLARRLQSDALRQQVMDAADEEAISALFCRS